MTTDNETIVRNAFAAIARGDVDSMLEMVDPDLEWTFLDPGRADPEPQVSHGREQLGRGRPATATSTSSPCGTAGSRRCGHAATAPRQRRSSAATPTTRRSPAA